MRVRRSILLASLVIGVMAWSPDSRAQIAWSEVEAGVGDVILPSSLVLVPSSATGPALGLGAGVRFSSWTFGLRGRALPTSSFTMFQGVLEVGFHPPAGRWQPYVSLHGGYVLLDSKEYAKAPGDGPGLFIPVAAPNPRGLDLGASVGGDFEISSLFSLGLAVTADAMFLSTPDLYFDPAPGVSVPALIANSSSGVGFAVIGSIHAGLRFDL